MKRHIIPCILSLTLLLTACGGEQAAADTAEEAVKDHYYQILDAAGKELYTVTDSGAVAEIDALINKAGGENADHGNAEGDPLYTYVYWQETTLHAGEDPDAEREYLEVFRTQVRQGSNAVTTEVLSDTLEGVGSFVGVEGLGGLLTFTAEVPRETADSPAGPGAVCRGVSNTKIDGGASVSGCAARLLFRGVPAHTTPPGGLPDGNKKERDTQHPAL